jgi:glycosyltransferase involved in cell wall biosynthesis
MAQRLKSTCGISSRVIRVIHNWADGASISPLEHNNNPLRTEWHLVHKFVIGYSGNLGRVHEFETLLGAAELLRNADDIRFLIIGSGARLEEVTRTIEHLGLSNVRVQPHQPRALLAQSLCVPDVHLCVLKPEFEGLVHPSKLYGIMAAGRPVVHIGAEDGETAALVKAAECGFVIPTGDAKGLAKLVSTLAQQPALCKAMGESGRREFLRRFDKSIAVAKWEGLLIEVSHQERCY